LPVDAKEFSVAAWTYWNERRAGRLTDTLPSAQATYFPLSGPRYSLGVIGVRLPSPAAPAIEQETLLQNFMAGKPIPGGTITITHNNKVVYERGIGTHSPGRFTSDVNGATRFTAIGGIGRLFGKRFLEIDIDKNRPSYWIKRPPAAFDPKQHERQF
jgi:hypothetical protein